MLSALSLAHPLSLLLALVGAWSTRFEFTRVAVSLWRVFLPALAMLLCALAMLLGLSTRGKELWLLALLAGLPFGAARGFSLKLRTDHAARLLRVSPVKDGLWIVLAATALATVNLAATMAHGGASPVSPLCASGVAMCAGALAGRAIALRLRARSAVHLDLV